MKPRRIDRGEEGATLVLALVFMIIVALVLVPLVTFSGNGLQNTSNLLQEQSLEYRSNGAVEVAIQTVRYTDATYKGGSCFASGSSTVQIGQAGPGNPPVFVNCVTVTPPPTDTGASREVNVYACGSTNCSATNYTVFATVDFQDGATCSTVSIGACGQLESIKSWLVHNAND
jgi:Tfp pilus assembly protein PilX